MLPDQIPSIVCADNLLEVIRAADQSWNQDKSTTLRSETHGIAGHAVRRVKESTSTVFWCRRVFQKSGGEKHWLLLVAKHTRHHWETERHRMKQDFGTPFDGSVVPLGTENKF